MNKKITRKVKNKIRICISENHLTQIEFAKACGLSHGTMSKILIDNVTTTVYGQTRIKIDKGLRFFDKKSELEESEESEKSYKEQIDQYKEQIKLLELQEKREGKNIKTYECLTKITNALDNGGNINDLIYELSDIWDNSIEENPLSEKKTQNLYFCKYKDADAKIDFINESSIVLLAGSLIQKNVTKTLGNYIKVIHKNLINDSVLIDNGNTYKLIENHIFKSPSGAACFVLGRNANGWTEWINKDGITLDEIERIK